MSSVLFTLHVPVYRSAPTTSRELSDAHDTEIDCAAVGVEKTPNRILDLHNVTISPFPCACGCCVPGYTDTCFSFPFYVVTLTDTMRSLDVSIPVSRDSYCTCMCHGNPPGLFFAMLTFSRLCFLLIFSYDDSSFPDLLTPVCYPDNSSPSRPRFFLHPVLYPTFRLLLTYPTGRYSCLVLLRLYASLYLYFP